LTVITVDQVISGASNVLIALLAARLLSAAEFGLFGIVFLVYTILVGITRALVSDLLLVHPTESQERSGEVIGTSCVLTLPLAGGLLLVALGIRALDVRLGDALIVLAACLPLLVLQDVGRYLAYAIQRPMRAVVLDSVWLLLLFGGVAVLSATGGRTLAAYIAAWAGSGAAAGLLLFTWYDIRGVRLGLSWLRDTWKLGWRYLVSYLSLQGTALGMASEVGAVAGAKALGGVQGALLLVRPFTTFQVAASAATIGEVARAQGHRRRIWRPVLINTALTAAVAGLNLLVMLILPDKLGKFALGASWHLAKPLLLPAGVQIVFLALLTGPQAALLGVRAMRKAMAINVAYSALILIAAPIGAAINGAKGALWLVTLAQGVVTLIWWITFWLHDPHSELAPVVADEEPASVAGATALTAQAVASGGAH
jgi:O-antigen/teichoic acid export membrane protein